MNDDQFIQSIAPHMSAILRVAMALVGATEADDVVQEATIRAWQAWPTMRDPASVRPWLLEIIYNTCYNWLKGRTGTHRRRTVALDLPRNATLRLRLPGGDPGSSDHTASIDLHEALSLLDGELHTTVVLRYFVGLDATEIGAAMNVPAATVRTRLRRALSLLRAHLCPTDHPAMPQKKGNH